MPNMAIHCVNALWLLLWDLPAGKYRDKFTVLEHICEKAIAEHHVTSQQKVYQISIQLETQER